MRSKQPHVKGILAQKPLALTLEEAIELRDAAKAAGKILSVNQNMRYDQSMRVLKQIIDRGELGEIVFAQIDMHAIPHWQTFLEDYDRLTLANMSVHHLDVLRFLFGDPTRSPRDPDRPAHQLRRITTASRSRRCASRPGVLALSLEDVWSGPREEGYKPTTTSRWRVEGTDGRRQGHDRLADGRGLDALLCLDRRRPAANG